MAIEEYTVTSRDCTKCGRNKPLDEFHCSKKGLYGRVSVCKRCSSEAHKIKFAKHRDEMNAKSLAAYHRRQEPKRRAKARALKERLDAKDKRCAKCAETKPKSEFGKDKSRVDGFRPYCKSCHSAGNRDWRKRNPDISAEASARWARNNKDRVAARVRKYYWQNPEKFRAYVAKWRSEHQGASRASSTRSARKRRMRAEVRLHDNIGNRIRNSLRDGKDGLRTLDILDYTIDELKTHLERQFLKGMSWDNYGEWHIDHITPLSSFTILGAKDPELRRAWCLTNLRPIWARDNLSKNCKITHLL